MKKFLPNLTLALIITLAFVTVEQIFRIQSDILSFNLGFKSFAEQYVIHLLIVSIISRRAILASYFLLGLLVWFQFLHFGYFGTWIFPLEYLLFFTQFQETYDTFVTVTDIAILPSVLIVLMLTVVYLAVHKTERVRFKTPYLSMLLIAGLIFIPARVYAKDERHGHRPNVEYYTLKNTFLTAGYLLGSILPKKLSGKSGLEQPILPTPPIDRSAPDVNVIVIMGESLHREYMSLYGYDVNTTPYLDSLKNDPGFFYRKAIASGVVTDVAVPSFFNMIKRPDGVPQILSTNTCLFKMAKENGFATSFFSSHSQSQLSHLKNYLCMKWIDDYRDGTTVSGDVRKPALDHFLIDVIDRVDFSKPNFLVLQQRASHTPFKECFPKEFEVFTAQNSAPGTLQNTIDYHNSIRYTDFILSQVIEKIRQKSTRPTYIVFTSDHATNLGDKDRNGHGRLDYDSVYQIPFFVYAINGAKLPDEKFTEFGYISHHRISELVSYLMGYQKTGNFNPEEPCYVCDSDISGLSGYLELSFDANEKQLPKIFD